MHISKLVKIAGELLPYYGQLEIRGDLGGRIEFCRTSERDKPGKYDEISAHVKAQLNELGARWLNDVGWYGY